MAKGSKLKTMAIKLLSSAGTGFFYLTRKNPRNVQHKLTLKKVSLLSFLSFYTGQLDWIRITIPYHFFNQSFIHSFLSLSQRRNNCIVTSNFTKPYISLLNYSHHFTLTVRPYCPRTCSLYGKQTEIG